MWEEEKEHRRTFEKLIPKYRARPSLLLPLWDVAGYMLGVGESPSHFLSQSIIVNELTSSLDFGDEDGRFSLTSLLVKIADMVSLSRCAVFSGWNYSHRSLSGQ
jgi:hypothetical protein